MGKLTKSAALRKLGIILVGGLIIISWWFGLFYIFFYILGLYGAVYIISYLFKTTAILSFLIGVGAFVLYAVSAIFGLYLLYIVLNTMFTISFITGLLQLILLSIVGGLLYFIPAVIGFVLGYPLIFMLNDIENRFSETPNNTKDAEFTENE